MKQLKAFILDDDQFAIDRLKKLLKKFTSVKIIGSELCAKMSIPQIMSNKPDLIFLDIEMPLIDGFELIDRIRVDNYNPTIIIVTGYDKYALAAIKKAAFDYLLKPVDPAELEKVIQRLQIRSERNDDKPEVSKILTTREHEIFQFLLKGLSSSEISKCLNISRNTVDTHRRNVLRKLKAESTTELIIRYSNH